MENKGLIIELFRFSMNDGPGIRTTVFLKGCPLNCKWCHNPESIPFNQQLSFNKNACVNCMKCVSVCDNNVHIIDKNIHIVNFLNCTLSGNCISVCDTKALSIIGYHQTVKEILDIVIKDSDYYKNSGGGITISGGEPMSQFGFTLELLIAAKKQGISTCLDTSGFASIDKFEKILPYVDVFLFDYKVTSEYLHKKLTGVSMYPILKNLDFLYKKEAEIILRCPMIPGVNDSDIHLKAIVELDNKYPRLKGIELMPYHKMGNEKGVNIGKNPEIDNLEDTDNVTQENWIKKLKNLGCTKAIIG